MLRERKKLGRFWPFLGVLGGVLGLSRGKNQIGGQDGAKRAYLGRADEAYSLPSVLDRAKNRGFFGVLGRSGAWMVVE